jgi:uncharacterized protein (TIRG00374 family)
MRWKLAATLLLTLAFLFWFLWGMDVDAFAVSISGLSWPLLLLSTAGYLSVALLRVWRMNALLERPVPFWTLFHIGNIGFLAINSMPLRLGELVRPYLLLERCGVPFGSGTAAVLTERLLDMLMLLALLMLLGFGLVLPTETMMVGDIDVLSAGLRAVGTLAGCTFLGLGAVLLMGEPVTRLARAVLRPMPLLRDRVPSFLDSFRTNIRTLARSPRKLATAVLMTAGIWASTLVAVRITLAAFPELPQGWAPAYAGYISAITGMTVAPTPGFFGSFELFAAAALRPWGADPDAARAFAVVYHLAIFVFTIGLGLISLLWEGMSLRQLVQASQGMGGREER